MSGKIKIAIISDSMAMPRGEKVGNISYESTYPIILEDNFNKFFSIDKAPRLIVRGKRSRTIMQVKEEWTEVIDFIKPQTVVIHVGITDCAPRILGETKRKLVDGIKIDIKKNGIINYLKRNRTKLILKNPTKRFVTKEVFEKEYKNIISHLTPKTHKIIFIGILNVSDDLEKKSPGYLESVKLYNSVLSSGADNKKIYFLDVNKEFEQNNFNECRLEDGYHYSIKGNGIVAGALFDILKHDFE